MDADRWRRVNELFHAALQRDAAERDDFLARACDGDAQLASEVESLLRSHAEAERFIETPAYQLGAALLHGDGEPGSTPDTESLVGQRIGPYVIESSLGYGGMGVVYLAEDTRLERKVAVKALADHLGRDARSRARLRREAKAAAALSHPGIATVFALEEFGDHLYIVYEYAEGETLREELARGRIGGDLLVRTALAMARALQAAHELGIVHRDLKPENVIRTPDGGIKILDFGLASFQRSTPRQPDGDSGEARLTLPGMLLGTPSYMAPEQLKGRAVDFRADLFAFGVLLHEMASGVHPFAGDDPASTIARILEVEPRALPGDMEFEPPGLRLVLRRLLAKEPEQRYPTTAELVTDLEDLVEGAGATGSGERDRTRLPGQRAATPTGEEHAGSSPAPPRHGPLWWWRFHQLALAVVYAAAYYGLWWVKEWTAATPSSLPAMLVFYVAVVPVMVAGSLRLHLAFAARYYPGELDGQRHRAGPWIRYAEFVYAVLLLAGAALIGALRPFFSVLMVAASAGILLSAQMIEPTTTRAAFPDR